MPKKVEKNLRRLTDWEVLWLIRLRQRKTQPEMAKHHGMCRAVYVQIELGRRPLPETLRSAIQRELRMDIRPAEMLRLARKRWGRGLRSVAGTAGVSHMTLLDWEKWAEKRLVDFWRARGFTFGYTPKEKPNG